jgi:hypothetical protein
VVDKGEVITLQVWDDPPAPETDKPDNSGPGKQEKTKKPKPEKTEKPGNGGQGEDPGGEDPGDGEDPTDELTEGSGVSPAAAPEKPAKSGQVKPDVSTQSDTGNGE